MVVVIAGETVYVLLFDPTLVQGPETLVLEVCHCISPPVLPVSVSVGDAELQYERKGVLIVPAVIAAVLSTGVIALLPGVISPANTVVALKV